MPTSDYVITLLGLSALLHLLAWLYVLSRWKVRPPSAWRLAVYCLLALAWVVGLAGLRLGWLDQLAPEFLARLPFYGLYVLGFAFLRLTRAFLRRSGPGWGSWAFALAWTGLLIALELNLFQLAPVLWSGYGYYLPLPVLVNGILVGGWALFWLGAARQSLQVARLSEPPLYRNVVTYWEWALALFLLGGGLGFLGYFGLGAVLLALAAGVAAYTALTRQLPDIRRMLRRVFYFVLVTGFSLVLYTGAYLAVQYLFPRFPGFPPLVAGIALALMLAFLLNPFLERLQRVIDRLLPGQDKDTAAILRSYSQKITHVLDLRVLATVVVETLNDALEVQRGYLFLVDYEKDPQGCNCFRLHGVRGAAENPLAPFSLAEDSPLSSYLCSERLPLTQYSLNHQPRFQALPPEERAWLEGLKTEVYVSIFSKDEWIGLLALGPQKNGVPYGAKELDLLGILADQTAVAMENVRLVEGLMRLNNEFRRAYAALNQANRNLERLDRTKSDFISVASHELRTPLTVLSGASQMLLDEPAFQENPYYKQLLSKIQSGTDRLHQIIESMLDMAKIDTRDLQLDPQPISLRALIDSVINELRPGAQERQQTLTVMALDQLPAIEADRQALRKVFFHLVNNAIKYTPDHGEIRLSGAIVPAGQQELPKGGVELRVQDTGIGIDPRFQQVIFAKFYQTGELALHSSGKTKFKGSGPGLGLAIAQGIVNAHGGRIWVESPGFDEERCPGSTFHVLLPLHQADDEKIKTVPRGF